MRKLPRSFYDRPTLDVAVDLLGCQLIRNSRGKATGGIIVEVEAYIGEDDPACHAFHGLTPRTKVMYGPPGHLYVYFTYGNHFMMNIVTEKRGFPAAVLLRAIEPRFDTKLMAKRRNVNEITSISSGPGKLTKSLGITSANNNTDLIGNTIHLKGPAELDTSRIMASPRIGIGERGSEKLWRFFLSDNSHVSRQSRYIRENTFHLKKAETMNFSL